MVGPLVRTCAVSERCKGAEGRMPGYRLRSQGWEGQKERAMGRGRDFGDDWEGGYSGGSSCLLTNCNWEPLHSAEQIFIGYPHQPKLTRSFYFAYSVAMSTFPPRRVGSGQQGMGSRCVHKRFLFPGSRWVPFCEVHRVPTTRETKPACLDCENFCGRMKSMGVQYDDWVDWLGVSLHKRDDVFHPCKKE